jgi:hypothetical protein
MGTGTSHPLIRIHAAYTRALDRAAEQSERPARKAVLNAGDMKELAEHVHCLVATLRGHHLSEDEVIFLDLWEVLTDTPYDLLVAQSREIEPLLAEIDAASRRVGEGPVEDTLCDLHSTLTRTIALWHRHYPIEEEHFAEPAAAAAIAPAEMARKAEQYARAAQECTGPDFERCAPLIFGAG